MSTEQLITKIVDGSTPSIQATVEQSGLKGALIVKDISAPIPEENASLVLTYTDGDVTKITKTIDGTDYEKILGYTDGVLTNISAWSEV
jgi:hypothetical protein